MSVESGNVQVFTCADGSVWYHAGYFHEGVFRLLNTSTWRKSSAEAREDWNKILRASGEVVS